MSVPNQQHVFYRGTEGHIHHILWDTLTAKLSADVWNAGASATRATGNPATFATPGQQHLFYRGQDGHIHHVVCVAEKRRLYRDVWTLRAGAPLAAGDPAAMLTEGQQHVFYRALDGNIEHLLWAAAAPDRVFHDQWTSRAGAPLAVGNPATMVTEGQQHVFYRSGDGHIEHLLWAAAASDRVFHDQWTSRAGAPLAAGEPATMVTEGQQHVFYRGRDGHIEHLLWAAAAPEHVFHDQWTSRAGAPLAAGDPATMVTEGQQHVFYRGLDGHIEHLLWAAAAPDRVFHDQWTSRAGAPLAAGNPATIVFGGQQHIFYQGSGGAVDHILWDPSSPRRLWFDDWTSRASAPMAEGNPATALSSDLATKYTWKILPLGDSITEGFSVPVPSWGGYRVGLFATATHRGKRITFVGSLSNGPADVGGVPFPPSHEGHSGKDINYIASIVPDALASEPDIVLLMIGTNDILQNNRLDEAPDRLATLLEKLIAADVGALIVVAQITPLPKHSVEVSKYNEGVARVARKLADRGERVLLADMHTGFPLSLLSPDLDPVHHTPDPTHPTQEGYDHMAAVWYAAIDTILT